MNTYLISYDLIRPEKDYSKIIEHLKSYGNWAKPLESVWLIQSAKTAEQIRDAAKTFIDANDKIFVIDVTNKYWGSYNLPEKVTAWMRDNL